MAQGQPGGNAPVYQVHSRDDCLGETKQAGGLQRHGQMVRRDRPGEARAFLPGSFELAAQTVSVGRGNQKSDGDLQLPRDAQIQAGRLLRRQLYSPVGPEQVYRWSLRLSQSSNFSDV